MEYVDRLGTCSYKWDGLKSEFGEDGLLAMWVADMDFPSPTCAVDALKRYVELPLGYFKTPDSYYSAVIDWERERHGYEIKREWISVTPGIVPALHWAVQTTIKPGDAAMISVPVYYPFRGAVKDSGCRLVENELRKIDGRYVFDFDQFERDIVENDVRLYILCNPHNPVGRVWTADELKRLLDICKKHGVKVISDEIHQDIINPKLGRGKVTAATVGNYDDMLITMASVSKTFNLAACQNSFIIIPNRELRESFQRFLSDMALDDVNGFGHIAAEAVMRKGASWLDEILEIIFGNYEYLKERFARECPDVEIAELEGTYLLWMDFGRRFDDFESLKDFLQGRCKLAFDYGRWFDGPGSDTCARVNLATSRENVTEACNRIIGGLAR